MSEKIDKTKKNVGISNLNDNTRKDLFNKFKEAGGEVVDERKKTKPLIIDRDKQRKHQQKVDSHSDQAF